MNDFGGTLLPAACVIFAFAATISKVTGPIYSVIITALVTLVVCLAFALATERSLRKQMESIKKAEQYQKSLEEQGKWPIL